MQNNFSKQNSTEQLNSNIESNVQQRLANLTLANFQLNMNSSSPNYVGMIQYLKAQKDDIGNFVARDKHEVEFLFRMSQDYESGLLPSKSKEAWEERVHLFYMVAEYGWAIAIENSKEQRIRRFGVEPLNLNFNSSFSPRSTYSRQRSRSRSPDRFFYTKRPYRR